MKWSFGLFVLMLSLIGSLQAAAAEYRVQGQALGPDNTPIAEGTVYLYHQFEVHTAALEAGSFAFDSLAPGPIHLTVYPAEFSLTGYSGFLGDDLEITLRAEPTGTVTLKVNNHRFLPLAGVRPTQIVVNDRFLVPVERFAEAGFPSFRSDDEGNLRLSFLPQGGFAKAVLRHFEYADLPLAYLPVTEAPQQVVLYPGVEIAGRVTLEGQGAAEALVQVYPESDNDYRDAATVLADPEGFFRMRLRDGDYYFSAQHPKGMTAAPRLAQVVKVGSEQEVTPKMDLELLPLRHISGEILYPDGEPCHGAAVYYRVDGMVTSDTYTTVEGKFRLAVGSPEGVLNIAPPPGFMMREMAEIPVDLQDAMGVELDPIRLEAIPELRGEVVDQDGAPAAGAIIRTLDLKNPLWAVTDEEGRFSIRIFEEPEEATVRCRVEHGRRFQRAEVALALDGDETRRIALESFAPEQSPQAAHPGGNDLDTLVNEEAPELACVAWFNREAPSFPTDAVAESTILEMDAFRGKVLVLYFWGGFDTTPEGRNGLAEMQAIHASMQDLEDVCIVGIHDATSQKEEVAYYIDEYRVAFPVGLDDGLSETFSAYRVAHIPQVVLIDKSGQVRYYQTHDRLLELIKVLRRGN